MCCVMSPRKGGSPQSGYLEGSSGPRNGKTTKIRSEGVGSSAFSASQLTMAYLQLPEQVKAEPLSGGSECSLLKKAARLAGEQELHQHMFRIKPSPSEYRQALGQVLGAFSPQLQKLLYSTGFFKRLFFIKAQNPPQKTALPAKTLSPELHCCSLA